MKRSTLFRDGLILFVLCLIQSSWMSSALQYPVLPEGNYTTSSSSPGQGGITESLSYLFQMSNGFTNIVFLNDLNAISDWLYDLVVILINGGDAVEYLQQNYNQLLTMELGYLICVAFGVLFILLVIFGGLIMCCCRTCCDNCGGEMFQSAERRKSAWRHCFFVFLLIFTVFMIVPAIFIFITNEWITEILTILPNDLTTDIDNIEEYITVIPQQLNTTIDGYDSLDSSIRTDFNNISNVLGVPIQTDITTLVQPALTQLGVLESIASETLGNLTAINSTTNTMLADLNQLEVQVNLSRDALLDYLNNQGATCTNDANCQQVIDLTQALDVSSSIDLSSLTGITSQINSVASAINSADITNIVATVNTELDNIPQRVVNMSSSVTSQVISGLDSAKDSLTQATSAIPQETLDSLTNTLNDAKTQINDILGPDSKYIGPYDIYRNIAFYVLGGIVLFICALYILGLALGACTYQSYTLPKYRSCPSDCAGVLIMMGVGFSFIFGWLLMILVIVTFSVGSPAERYGCQPLESPYIGLQFADRVLNATNTTTISVGGQTLHVSVYNTVKACQENQGIYTALNLESIYNATEIVDNVTASLDEYKQDLANLTIDLSSIVIYDQQIENSLNSLTTMGLDTVTVDTTPITNGINAASNALTTYAGQLNSSADSITDPTIASTIRAYSYNFTIVDATYIPPLTNAVPNLDSSLSALTTISASLNSTVDSTKVVLENTDAAVQANGSSTVTDQVTTFSNNIFSDVNNYTSWLLIQLQDNVGACRPVFNAYTDAVDLLCGYAIDTLSGLWFSLGWAVFFLIPSAILGMKLAKFYRKYQNGEYESDAHWNELEMDAYTHANNNGNIVPGGKPQKGRLRSARIHPSEYY